MRSFQMKLQFYLISLSVFDWGDGFIFWLKGCKQFMVSILGVVVQTNLQIIVDMESFRHPSNTINNISSEYPSNEDKKISNPLLVQGDPSNNFKNRRSRQWSGLDKLHYGKLLLSYLMNNLEVNQHFIEHFAHLLGKTCKDISIFHRKMLSEFKSVSTIVTHLLKHKAGNRSHQYQEKTPCTVSKNYLTLEDFNQEKELLLDQQQQNYLTYLVFAQESLEQYEENLSDHGQVEDLDDSCFNREEKTNDSFDSNENNNERGNEEDYSFNDCFIE